MNTETTPRITADMAGTWLDGSQGWRNAARVVWRAQEYGFTIDTDDAAILSAFYAGPEESVTLSTGETLDAESVAEAVSGQGELSDRATAYLNSLAPDGYVFEWDAGELAMVVDVESDTVREYLERFIAAYKAAALWSSTMDCICPGADESELNHDADNEHCNPGKPYNSRFSPDDFDARAESEIESDCTDFVGAQWALLRDLDAAQCGHDFWLTRNGHGAGFWDRGLGARGDALTDASKPYGSCDLYQSDTDLIGVQ